MVRAGLDEIAGWARREVEQQPLPGRGREREQEEQGSGAAVWLERRSDSDTPAVWFLWGH